MYLSTYLSEGLINATTPVGLTDCTTPEGLPENNELLRLAGFAAIVGLTKCTTTVGKPEL